jgi:two-component system KDP operon response regulator KdpE
MIPAQVLIVDDDPKLVHLVREVLNATGYDVIAASSGERAIKMVALEQPDLILLDIMLSGAVNGYEVSRRVREFSDIPIIMLTAKVKESDILTGFNAGADDYITKPFSSKELLVRVRAVLKRARIDQAASTESEIICGDLRIDLARHRVKVGEQDIHLTNTEYKLLYELATHHDQVLMHEQLLTAVWGAEYRDDLDYLRTYIYHLRKKLEADPANPQLIIRCPGVGYMLACEDQEC